MKKILASMLAIGAVTLLGLSSAQAVTGDTGGSGSSSGAYDQAKSRASNAAQARRLAVPSAPGGGGPRPIDPGIEDNSGGSGNDGSTAERGAGGDAPAADVPAASLSTGEETAKETPAAEEKSSDKGSSADEPAAAAVSDFAADVAVDANTKGDKK